MLLLTNQKIIPLILMISLSDIKIYSNIVATYYIYMYLIIFVVSCLGWLFFRVYSTLFFSSIFIIIQIIIFMIIIKSVSIWVGVLYFQRVCIVMMVFYKYNINFYLGIYEYKTTTNTIIRVLLYFGFPPFFLFLFKFLFIYYRFNFLSTQFFIIFLLSSVIILKMYLNLIT